MQQLSTRSRRPDLMTAGWLMSICWLLASFGGSILQMWLLAHGWQLDHSASFCAALFALWIAGALVASHRHLFWMVLGGGGTLSLFFASTSRSLALFSRGSLLSVPAQNGLLWGILALCCGASLQRWLGKARPGWQEISEHPRHFRQLCALTVGLAVVWWQPTAPWSLLLAALLCLPLLALDLSCWSPLPVSAHVNLWRMHPGAVSPVNWPLDLDDVDLSPGWMWVWLKSERQLALVLLAAGVNIVLVVVWGSLAVPFAAAVGPTSPLLVFLALSQVVVLLLGRLLTETGLRGLIGKPFRPLPPGRRWIGKGLLLFVLLGMPCCLLLLGLGLPLSWPVVLVFSAYTLCGACWSHLLPRVLLTSEMRARETPLAPSVWRLPSEWPDQQATLAVARAQEQAIAGRLEQMSVPFLLV
jgi:hypothetical protein